MRRPARAALRPMMAASWQGWLPPRERRDPRPRAVPPAHAVIAPCHVFVTATGRAGRTLHTAGLSGSAHPNADDTVDVLRWASCTKGVGGLAYYGTKSTCTTAGKKGKIGRQSYITWRHWHGPCRAPSRPCNPPVTLMCYFWWNAIKICVNLRAVRFYDYWR